MATEEVAIVDTDPPSVVGLRKKNVRLGWVYRSAKFDQRTMMAGAVSLTVRRKCWNTFHQSVWTWKPTWPDSCRDLTTTF